MPYYPTDRNSFKEYCLRQVGAPVHDIEIDDAQVEDAIEDALQFFREYHHDSTERTYIKHQLTEEDLTNKWIPVSDSVIGITRIFPPVGSNITVNMFDLRYQMRLHDLYNFTSASYVGYVMTMQHIRTLDMLFSGETPIRFNRHSNRLYIDWDWNNEAIPGRFIVAEAYIILNPDEYNEVWNDRLFKRLGAARVKKLWGTNLKKYSGLKLPDGIEPQGQLIYEEAVAEIKEIEDLIRSNHEMPPEMIIG